MEISRDTKLIVITILGFLILLAAGIYKDKLILLTVAIVGAVVLLFLIAEPVRLIYAQIIYICVIKFSMDVFNVPSFANYMTDFLTLLIVIVAIREFVKRDGKTDMLLPMSLVAAFFMVTVIGLLINGQSIPLYAWGFRNNFRFYGFFFGCAILLKKKDIDRIFKILLFISAVNVLFCTVQYFVLGYSGDYLGGIFGMEKGVNIYLNVFICMITTIALIQYLNKKVSIPILIFAVFTSLYIAAIGEIKVFFIEIIIITAGAVLFSKPGKKTILILLASAFGLYWGIELFYSIFPYWQGYFNLESMLASGQKYATSYDLGRFNAIERVTSTFLSGDMSKLLFGLGLGSAETSQLPIFTSQFYYQYGSTLHYTWLSQAFMLIENGWVGLICFMGFFVSIAGVCFFIRSKISEYFDYCVIAQIFAILCCALAIYNSTLRTEAAYFAYFMLALPFALNRNERGEID
ncbi:MAG: hypothetical protein AB9844_12200 [Clostridiaceae bacterium]